MLTRLQILQAGLLSRRSHFRVPCHRRCYGTVGSAFLFFSCGLVLDVEGEKPGGDLPEPGCHYYDLSIVLSLTATLTGQRYSRDLAMCQQRHGCLQGCVLPSTTYLKARRPLDA